MKKFFVLGLKNARSSAMNSPVIGGVLVAAETPGHNGK